MHVRMRACTDPIPTEIDGCAWIALAVRTARYVAGAQASVLGAHALHQRHRASLESEIDTLVHALQPSLGAVPVISTAASASAFPSNKLPAATAGRVSPPSCARSGLLVSDVLHRAWTPHHRLDAAEIESWFKPHGGDVGGGLRRLQRSALRELLQSSLGLAEAEADAALRRCSRATVTHAEFVNIGRAGALVVASAFEVLPHAQGLLPMRRAPRPLPALTR